MSVATFMGICSTHPKLGYYTSTDPLGKKGDFVTAPEISQMFGEMLGAWVLTQWHVLGRPERFELLELGPGRGTLMADMLRVISKDRQALTAMELTLFDVSPPLIEKQKQALAKFKPRWIESIAALERGTTPLIIIANEFFDALPIHQYQFQNGAWHERLIGLRDGRLAWGLAPNPLPPGEVPAEFNAPAQGEIWETSPVAQNLVAELADLLNRRGGTMMVIDYGYEKTRTGDTFQAIADHEFADPLENPGTADLSAHVNFSALIEVANSRGAAAQMAGTQGQVLKQLGIVQRAEKLIASNPEKAQSIKADLNRLVDPDQMGDLFKVMAVQGVKQGVPFEQDEALARINNITHGFFGRRGGVSPGDFASLNVSVSVADDKKNVAANRTRIMDALGLPPPKLATLSQVHSTRVITVSRDFDFSSRPEADGMVTKSPGIALGVLSADCTPVLFADPGAGIIGACHAGWRGAVDGIITSTIAAMSILGAEPARIIAAIGPTIFMENYEVGPDFTADFLARHKEGKRFITRLGSRKREHFDLPGFVRAELERSGITQIGLAGACTYANPEYYFSHRHATHNKCQTGRQISIIALK
ncbi:MAG TPA: peptidoglycan editing factor PgeF [Devosia sp.]|nr:peptidoglycan editing factor PgeF [Devosia sp.]